MTEQAIPIDLNDREKKGSKCCGCCCDMRRAVLVVSVIQIILSIISGIMALNGNTYAIDTEDYDTTSYDDVMKTAGIVTLVGIVFHVSAFAGAIMYKIWMVFVGVLWYIISYIVGVVLSLKAVDDFNEDNPNDQLDKGDLTVSFVISAVVTALFIYPRKYWLIFYAV